MSTGIIQIRTSFNFYSTHIFFLLFSSSSSLLSSIDKAILSKETNMTVDEISSNVVALNIYFSSLELQEIKIVDAYPVLALFSDIGGKQKRKM